MLEALLCVLRSLKCQVPDVDRLEEDCLTAVSALVAVMDICGIENRAPKTHDLAFHAAKDIRMFGADTEAYSSGTTSTQINY